MVLKNKLISWLFGKINFATLLEVLKICAIKIINETTEIKIFKHV